MTRRSFSLIFLGTLPTVAAYAAAKNVSDDLIYDRLKQKLATDAIVKGGALDIEVKDGAVTLRGKVDSQKRKDKAEKLAKKVSGVKSVTNEIQIVQ